MGSVERRTDHYLFGHRIEDRCCGLVGYPNEVEGVIENEMNSTYQLGATVYGSDGMLDVSDNTLKYMVAGKAGWQEFNMPEKFRVGVIASGRIARISTLTTERCWKRKTSILLSSAHGIHSTLR